MIHFKKQLKVISIFYFFCITHPVQAENIFDDSGDYYRYPYGSYADAHSSIMDGGQPSFDGGYAPMILIDSSGSIPTPEEAPDCYDYSSVPPIYLYELCEPTDSPLRNLGEIIQDWQELLTPDLYDSEAIRAFLSDNRLEWFNSQLEEEVIAPVRLTDSLGLDPLIEPRNDLSP